LGSGASYGSGLPLNRERSAELLGFGRPIGIAMRDANSRGKVETAALDAIGSLINDASRFAADMVFFTSAEAGFFVIGAGFTTGSSIMPQKKNLDLFELIRGRAASYGGLKTASYAITCGLPSGYSRDLQDTKPHLIDGVQMGQEILAVLHAAVPTLQPVESAITAALTQDIYATDEAFRLVTEEGMTFRDAYVHVGQHLDRVPVPSTAEEHAAILKRRSHTGSTGKLGLEHLQDNVAKARAVWQQRRDDLHKTWQTLLTKDPGDGKRRMLGKPTAV
jgi:argininosuccinate lyase